MAVIGSATLNIVPKVQGGLANAINGEVRSANLSGVGKSAGASFMSGLTSGASFGLWSNVASRAIDTVTSSLGSAAGRVDTLNNYPRIMESLGVETAVADRSIQTMSESLSNVPTKLDDMASTVQGIFAATTKYGTSLDTVTDAGLALNSMLLAGGQSTQVVNSAMEQFRQMVAKGKPDLQDWRSLISAAPGQMNQLAEAMLGAGASADDLYAALGGGKEGDYTGPFEWGSISMGEFVERFAQLREQFEGDAQDAQGGIATSFSNMQNAVTRGVAGVLEAFGQDRIAGAIGDVKAAINGAFGTDETEGIRGFAADVAPLVGGIWDSMVEGASDLSGRVSPYVGEVFDTVVEKASEVAPAVEGAFGAVADAIADVTPEAAELAGVVVEAAGDTVETIAGVVSDVMPVVSGFAKDVLPVVTGLVEDIGPALAPLLVAKTAFDGLGVVGGTLSALGGGVTTVTGALGAFGSVLPMVGGLADVGPALSLVAESGKLMGASGVVGSLGGMATALSETIPLVQGISDIPDVLAIVSEAGGGVAAALNPVPLLAGAAAVGIGALGVQAYQSHKRAQEWTDAIVGVHQTAMGLTDGLQEGARSVERYGGEMGRAKPDIEGLTEAMEAYAETIGSSHDAAESQIGMLGQYRTVIDEAARATADGGELSKEAAAKVQWALDGLNELAGTDYQISDIINPDEPDKIRDTVTAIDELISKMQQQARTEALQDALTESYKLQQQAATELSRAEADYYENHDAVVQQMMDRGYSLDEAESAWAKTHADEADALQKATEAYDVATTAVQTNEQALGNAAAATGEAGDALTAWYDSSVRAQVAMSENGVSLEALSAAMEAAGVSTEALTSMSESDFGRMASACGGSVDGMVQAIALYNATPVVDKDGSVSADVTQLIDAEGHVYTWNGTALVNKSGKAVADDKRLMDAYGNVVTWNGTQLTSKRATVTTSEGGLGGLIQKAREFMGLPSNMTRTATYTTTNRTINETINTSADKSASRNTGRSAHGAHVEPRHAAGVIVTGPTHTGFGLVGEDGIEAMYRNADGSTDVYPMNNPRYLHYADPLADRIAARIADGHDAKPSITINVTAKGDPSQIADAIANRVKLLGL